MRLIGKLARDLQASLSAQRLTQSRQVGRSLAYQHVHHAGSGQCPAQGHAGPPRAMDHRASSLPIKSGRIEQHLAAAYRRFRASSLCLYASPLQPLAMGRPVSLPEGPTGDSRLLSLHARR
jgi:hypothetical protein